MIDIEKLKNHFKYFKNSGLVNSESIKDRTDAFERFCQKGVPTLKQEYWKYSPLSKDLFQFENLKFAVNQNEYFDKAKYEKFDHYQIVLKDGILISDNIINCDLLSESVKKTYPKLPFSQNNWSNFKDEVYKRNDFLKNLDNEAYQKIKDKFPDFKPPK